MSEVNEQANVNAENVTTAPANAEAPVTNDPTVKVVAKAKDTEPAKKPNFIKRGYRKVRDGMSKHPFWTAFGGAAVGSAATYGGAKLCNHLVENHRRKQREAGYQNPPPVSPLDPNVD